MPTYARLYAYIKLFEGMQFILPIYILFEHDYLHFSYSQIGAHWGLFLVVSVLFDYVFGAVADRWGARRAYIAGQMLQMFYFGSFLVVSTYGAVLVASVVGGLGQALGSNSLNTLVHKKLETDGQQKYYPQVLAHAQQMFFVGRIAASVIGGFVYAFHPYAAYLCYLGALAIAAGMALALPHVRQENLHSFHQIVTESLQTVSKVRGVMPYLALMFATVLLLDVLFLYYQPYFGALGASPHELGIMFAGISLVAVISARIGKRHLSRHSAGFFIRLALISAGLTAIGLWSTQLPLVYFVPLIMSLSSGVLNPSLQYTLTCLADNHSKTSVVSIGTMCASAGTAGAFFLSGHLADHFLSSEIFLSVITVSIMLLVATIAIPQKFAPLRR